MENTRTLPSKCQIDETITSIHDEDYIVRGVRFTKSKVFYDVEDDDGIIHYNVDSAYFDRSWENENQYDSIIDKASTFFNRTTKKVRHEANKIKRDYKKAKNKYKE